MLQIRTLKTFHFIERETIVMDISGSVAWALVLDQHEEEKGEVRILTAGPRKSAVCASSLQWRTK